MFRHELSPFLVRVLDAAGALPGGGILVDAGFEPDTTQIARIAARVGASDEEIREALLGLRAVECLIEESLEVPGIDPLYFWRVHPQCARSGRQDHRS